MIKIIGAMLIIGGATFSGLAVASGLSARARILRELSRLMDIIRAEICERLTPLDSLLVKLSEMSGEPWSDFFAGCASDMKLKRDTPFAIIWSKRLAHSEALRLRPSESEEISALGNVLGRFSASEQGAAISHTARSIDSMATVAEREKEKLGKMYAKLGVICGVAVVIVFI